MRYSRSRLFSGFSSALALFILGSALIPDASIVRAGFHGAPATPSPFFGCTAVTWEDQVNVTPTNDGLQKTGGIEGSWDAGAASLQTINSGDGYAQSTLDSVSTYRAFGLSTGDTSPTLSDIDFAAYLAGTTLQVYESGAAKYSYGPLLLGQAVSVSVQDGAVRYYVGGIPVYTSTLTPVYPLLLDTSIASRGGRLSKVRLCAGDMGPTPTPTATPSPTQTPSPTATPSHGSYMEMATKPYGVPGVVNEMNLMVWGPDSWRKGGDAYSPTHIDGTHGLNPWHDQQPYGYLYRVDVPQSYPYDRVSVQIWDPDAYNRPGTPPPWPTPNACSPAPCTPTPTLSPSPDQYASCTNPSPGSCTSNDARYNTGMKLNAFPSGRTAFWRIDELRHAYNDPSGNINPSGSEWSDAWATTTQYTIWHFRPNLIDPFSDPATLSDQSGGKYIARYMVGNDPSTDLSWYQPAGFDITLRDRSNPACVYSGGACFAPEASGGWSFYLYVQSTAGSSENNFDLRAGPPDLNPTNLCTIPSNCYINQQYATGAPDWNNGGVMIMAERSLPMNLDTGAPIPMAFTQVSRDLAGQTISMRHFDQDCNNGCGSQMNYQMLRYDCDPSRPSCWVNVAVGYVGPDNDWTCATCPDPEAITVPTPGSKLYNLIFGPNGEGMSTWLRVQTYPGYNQDSEVWEVPFLTH